MELGEGVELDAAVAGALKALDRSK
jgi:hypothetical protein